METKVVGAKLKKLRMDSGRSRQDIADLLNISVSAVSNYENGCRIPRDEIKKRISNCYGISVEEIFFT